MGKGSSGATFCEVLIAILLPPLGVFLKYACGVRSIFFLCLLEPTVVDVLVAVEVPHVAFGSFEKLFHIFSVSVWNACIGYITDWRERFASLFAVLKVSGYNSIEFQDDVFVLLTILFGSLQLGLDSFDCSWSFGYASSWPSLVTFPASCTLSMWSWHRERGAGTPPSLASSAWTGWSVQEVFNNSKSSETQNLLLPGERRQGCERQRLEQDQVTCALVFHNVVQEKYSFTPFVQAMSVLCKGGCEELA